MAEDQGDLLAQFGEFLEAKAAAAAKASQSEHDGDDFEWWEESKEGGRRGTRTTVRAAKQHGPGWVKEFFAEPEKGDKTVQGDGGQGDGGKPAPKTLFPGRKPPAGQQGS